MPFRRTLKRRYLRRGPRRGMLNPRNVTHGLRAFKSRGFTARLRLRKRFARRRNGAGSSRRSTTARITRARVYSAATPPDSSFLKIPYKNYLTNILGDGVKVNLQTFFPATWIKNPLGGNALNFVGQTDMGNKYSRYYVSASRLRVKMWNPNSHDYLVTLVPMLTSSIQQQTSGNEEGIWSLPRAKTVLLLRGTMNNSNSVRYLSYYMTTKKMFPDDDPAEEAQYQGNMSATTASIGNPGTTYYWLLLVTMPDGTPIPDLNGPVFEVSMTQYVRFTRVRPQGSTDQSPPT